MFNTIVFPHLDCCTVWGKQSDEYKKLQRIRNCGMRIILNCPSTTHISDTWSVRTIWQTDVDILSESPLKTGILENPHACWSWKTEWVLPRPHRTRRAERFLSRLSFLTFFCDFNIVGLLKSETDIFWSTLYFSQQQGVINTAVTIARSPQRPPWSGATMQDLKRPLTVRFPTRGLGRLGEGFSGEHQSHPNYWGWMSCDCYRCHN